MLWKLVLRFITILQILSYASTEKNQSHNELSCTNQKGHIFDFVNITSFIDENRYIRLNISWEGPKANFTNFDITIETNCSALYGEVNVPVEQRFIIEPNMERLKHPADPLMHGCKYEFELYTEAKFGNESCNIWQVIDYEIPECVGTVCQCAVTNPPYEYYEIKPVGEDLYEIKFYKTDEKIDLDLEAVFHRIFYANAKSNRSLTSVHLQDINFENDINAFTLPLNDIHSGNSYIIYIDLVLDSCEYHITSTLQVPQELISDFAKQYGSYFVILIVICVGISVCAFVKAKSPVVEKLRRYLPFLPLPELPISTQEMGMVKLTKEVINSQYTPLEFVVNAHKFDKYEFPRNKLILKSKIGGGAFGHVYRAEIYELDNKPGYTIAAAKKPIENAPAEELADFLAEIDTMKKIADFGGHRNVIRILGCVTIESPPIMVMELVPCGSLKTYLSNLRKEWEQRKKRLRIQKNNQHFFPDNMIVENFIHPLNGTSEKDEPEKLKYSDLAFDDYTGCSNSSGTNSYVTPDTPRTPTTPGTPLTPGIPRIYNKTTREKLKQSKVSDKTTAYLAPLSPVTPNSITSSGLPSVTETLLTPLGSEAATPLIDITEEDTVKPVLDSKELQNFALQIANGMAFLESLDLTHRDLAARNILINEEKLLKISDFGMARSGVYVNTTQKRQPLRWMAPEAIENRRCDNKTDVWSFGVVLWEIGSLGAFPYKDLTNELVIAHIMQGKILERPETCTDQLYELMQKCWQKNPDDRPTFEEIAKNLDISNGKIYVDFSKISPKYIFPPS